MGTHSPLTRVEIVCYASAHKLNDNHYEIVVCDEVHLGLSPVYRKFFREEHVRQDPVHDRYSTEEDEYKLLLRELAPTVYTITIDQCVAKGLVAPYDIYCIPVELTDVERAAYKKANNLFVQCKYRLGRFDAFNEANRILRGGPGDKGAAARFFNSIRQRKAVVQHAENKLSLAKQIAEHHSEHKILTFSGTNEFTNMMAEELDGLVYHSGKTKKKREQTLGDFKATDGAVLCSTKALNPGFDIPSVGVVCAGLESKSLPMIQRVGRHSIPEGKRGRVYILYVADSQEEKWMDQATQDFTQCSTVTSLTNLF